MKKTLLILLFFAAVVSLTGKEPKYIFLFIGDGMATPQRMIADEFSRKIGKGKLALNDMPYHATTRTCSANSLVTDSAAAATAIACGTKTNNGMLGVDPQLNRLTSTAEAARDKGRKVGIITSVTLNHATPGGFYGHRKNRSMGYELGLDLVASNFDFFGGGGISKYNPEGKKDIYTIAREAGYTVTIGKEDMNTLKPGQKAIALAKSRKSAMPYTIDNEPGVPSLADITAKAIELLSTHDKGFFMMIEGGSIDWAGHSNEAAANLFEVLALDQAVKTALKFYEKHPDETLIIVTGDHETGGMTMGFAGTGYAMYMERLAFQKCSVVKFEQLLKAAMGRKPDITFEDVKPMLTEYFGFEFAGDSPMRINEKEMQILQDGFAQKKLPLAAKTVINGKAGIGWTSGSHTALPVLTTAIGAGAEKFTGFIDNTDIARKIKDLL